MEADENDLRRDVDQELWARLSEQVIDDQKYTVEELGNANVGLRVHGGDPEADLLYVSKADLLAKWKVKYVDFKHILNQWRNGVFTVPAQALNNVEVMKLLETYLPLREELGIDCTR